MKKILWIILAGFLLVGTGCASKRFVKRGAKYEQAGMWELATEAYLRSLKAKKSNIDALVGLRRAGQKVIEERSVKLVKAYESDSYKQVVYLYRAMDELHTDAIRFGVELAIPERATDYYNDAKPRYLEQLYAEAKRLLEEEKFGEAEQKLSELKSIEPDYEEVSDLLKISKCEPLYRKGKEFMEQGYYRKAYANFQTIISKFGTYKEAALLKDEAYGKALITIKVDPFIGGKPLAQRIQSYTVAKINALNNPFIKLLDTDNTGQLIDEQRRSEELGGNVEVGNILAAKAILKAEVVDMRVFNGKLVRKVKRGYIKQESRIKKPGSDEYETKVSYKKVEYTEYSIKNSASISCKFSLISTETGAVLLSNIAKGDEVDRVSYAVFDGPADKLIPGYWESRTKDSPKDVINDDSYSVSRLRKLLKAPRKVASVSSLTGKAIEEVAISIARAIDRYNPEK